MEREFEEATARYYVPCITGLRAIPWGFWQGYFSLFSGCITLFINTIPQRKSFILCLSFLTLIGAVSREYSWGVLSKYIVTEEKDLPTSTFEYVFHITFWIIFTRVNYHFPRSDMTPYNYLCANCLGMNPCFFFVHHYDSKFDHLIISLVDMGNISKVNIMFCDSIDLTYFSESPSIIWR